MELMTSGDILKGSRFAAMKGHEALPQAVAGLFARAAREIGDVRLARLDRRRDSSLGHAPRKQVGDDVSEVRFHNVDDTAFAMDCKSDGGLAYRRGPKLTPDEEMTIGERLREARKARKLSQEALARLAQISQTTISDLERGRNTSSTELPALAAVLGVSALWLATGKGSRQSAAPIAPVSPQRHINAALFVAAWQAVSAYRQQSGVKLDDEEVIKLACRVYEQHIDTPNKSSAEMLGYLLALTDLVRNGGKT